MNSSEWLQGKMPPVPKNEKQRLQALHRYEKEDKEPEHDEAFDRLAELASVVSGKPIAFINLIGAESEFKKACYGFNGSTTPRTVSFCQFTIMNDEILEVKDAQQDEIFMHNPNVRGLLNLRYYAGVPLKAPDGSNIGSLCIIDHEPGSINGQQKAALKTIAEEVISRFELNAARNELDFRNKQKDELIRIVSHDMRNPLTGIIGFSSLLKEELHDEELMMMAGNIEKAGKSMLDLVNVLLNSEYIRSASYIIKKTPCDASKVTREIVELHRPMAQLKQISVITNIAPSIFCELDVEKWKQILGNLLNNSIKFTPAGGRVEIGLERTEGDRTFLQLIVKDTGIGIPPNIRENLFTGKESILRKGTEGEASTGLGMYIIKKYIRLMYGLIDLESSVENGTTFKIRIPVEP